VAIVMHCSLRPPDVVAVATHHPTNSKIPHPPRGPIMDHRPTYQI